MCIPRTRTRIADSAPLSTIDKKYTTHMNYANSASPALGPIVWAGIRLFFSPAIPAPQMQP
jgi:hypothetical protein